MYRVFLTVLILILWLYGCAELDGSDQKEVFKQESKEEVLQIIPKKPVRIELRRTAKGKYSWTLKGEDVEEIIKIDSRLRNTINKKDTSFSKKNK